MAGVACTKLRQALMFAPSVVAMVKAPPAPVTPVTTTHQAPAVDPAGAMLTVSINGVIAQGLEAIRVPLMSDEEFQDGMERCTKVEGKYPDDGGTPNNRTGISIRRVGS